MTRWTGKILLVLGSGLGMYFSIGIVLIHGFGVFILPIAEDTGWDRRSIAAVVAPVALVNGLMSPLVGVLTDRFGPRSVLTVSSVTTGVGLAGIGLTSGSLSAFVAAVVLASILGGAQTGVPYTQVVVGWFNARRGLALGAMLSFVGLGIASVPPMLSLIIATWGWRSAFVMAGLATMLVTLPIALFLIRDPPARRPGGEGEGHTVREAMMTPSFWLMLGAFFMNHLVAAGARSHCPSSLRTEGCRQAMPPSS